MIDLNIRNISLVPFASDNHANLIIIGAGGTGSLFVRDITRYIASSSDNVINVDSIFIVDGDTVETKNITRQNFIMSDVGSYKAEVLATRYGTAFGMPIVFANEYFDNKFFAKYDYTIRHRNYSGSVNSRHLIITSFVDSVKTRLLLYTCLIDLIMFNGSYAYDFDSIIWIDAGNMKYNGQVVVSYIPFSIMSSLVHKRFDGRTNYLIMPTVVNLHRDLLVRENLDKYAYEMSCEEAAQSFPQTMNANLTAANISLNALTQILKHGEINYSEVFFDCVNNSYRTTFLDSNFNFLSLSQLYNDYVIAKELIK